MPSGFRRRGKFLCFRGGLQDGVLARAFTPRPSDIGADKIGSTLLDHVFPCVVDMYIPDPVPSLDFAYMLNFEFGNAFWNFPGSCCRYWFELQYIKPSCSREWICLYWNLLHHQFTASS